MTADDIIKEAEQNASEWLEMSQYPTHMLVGILAQKIVNLRSHIEYLERLLKYEVKK